MPEDVTPGQEQQSMADQATTPKEPLFGPIPIPPVPPEPILQEPVLPKPILPVPPGPLPVETLTARIDPHRCHQFPPGPLMLQGKPNSTYLVGSACGTGTQFHLDNSGNGHWSPVPSRIARESVYVTNNSNSELFVTPDSL